MKITPAWKDAEGKGLKDLGWALQYEGSIESEEEIEIEIGSRWLKLSGSLKSQRWHQGRRGHHGRRGHRGRLWHRGRRWHRGRLVHHGRQGHHGRPLYPVQEGY